MSAPCHVRVPLPKMATPLAGLRHRTLALARPAPLEAPWFRKCWHRWCCCPIRPRANRRPVRRRGRCGDEHGSADQRWGRSPSEVSRCSACCSIRRAQLRSWHGRGMAWIPCGHIVAIARSHYIDVYILAFEGGDVFSTRSRCFCRAISTTSQSALDGFK